MKRLLISCVIALLAVLSVYGESVQDEATRMEAIMVLVSATERPLIYNEYALNNILDGFTDLQELSESDKKVLAFVVEEGIIQGYPDKTIRPNATITRAEYAVIIKRFESWFENFEYLGDNNTEYKDIESWNSDGISFCITHGIMMGYGDRFGSDDNLTKEQLEIISRRVVDGLLSSERATVKFLNADVKLNASYVASLPFERDALLNVTDLPEGYQDAYYMWMKTEIPGSEPMKHLSVISNLSAASIIKTATNYIEEHSKASAGSTEFESVFISDFDNVYSSDVPPLITNYVAKGYEYFIYYGGDSSVSDKYEIGKWYRRPVKFHSHVFHKAPLVETTNTVEYYDAELLDESFYKTIINQT